MGNTALLIIDVQNGFINEHTQHVPQLAEQKQTDYDFVWATKLVYSEDSPFITIRKHSGFDNVENPTELAFTLESTVGVIIKHGYSGATPELLDLLGKHSIDQIDLMGVDTDQCVLATALALFDASITPNILTEYCASTAGSEMHEVGIRVMRRALGKQNIIQ